MFLEDEDWNDDRGAEVVSPTKPKESSSPVKTKVVGKKSLLRTLQTLGSVPDWKSEQPQKDSDSETETPTEHAHKKRKKRRKRRHSETQQTDGDLSQRDSKETAVVRKKKEKLGKKRKPTTTTTTDVTQHQESPKPAKVDPDSSENKLSRQQWKNKMKNKRKSNNKFKSTDTEDIPKEDTKPNCDTAKTESVSKNVAKKKVKKQKISEKVTVERAVEIGKKNTKKEICSKGSKELRKQEEGPIEINKKQITENIVVMEDKHIELSKHQKSELSKKQNLKREKLRKLLQSQSKEAVVPEEEVILDTPDHHEAPDHPGPPDASATLRAKMEQRLESARFRYINEVLYSSTSGEAKRMFTQDPHSFWVYHRGYSAQVQRWPTNPVDNIIQFIQKRPPSQVVADFGCGDCKIAQSVKNKVHCFDLVATCDLVTACDMAHVPLKDRSVDIAVFCLSLMGTNLTDFLKEANRVLKMGGVLKIAEVSSRFDNERSFISALAGLGFKLVSKDTENTHFFSFEFMKTGEAPDTVKKSGLQLKPCLYKKR